MNKVKWSLKRFFALALAAMMILTVPEVSAAAVLDVEVEDAVVESTETNDVVEEEATGEEEADTVAGANKAIADEKTASNSVVTPIEGVIDLGSTETSAYSFSFFTETTDYVTLTSGNHEEWIDRIDVPDYAITFYNALVEGADNDGTDDILIDGTTEMIAVTTVTCALADLDSKANEVGAIIRATYDAFDRDHPEVFWLSGNTYATYSGTKDDTNAYVTFYFALNTTVDGSAFDVRSSEYSDAETIKAAIKTRDDIVDIILGEITTEDTTVDKIRLFNAYLTLANEYCTTEPYPSTSYECLSALIGSTGASGPVCEAYARAFKVLCDNAGIPCVLVDGTAYNGVGREAHMWNYVQVNGAWYAVDVTWNDPAGGNSGAESGYECEDWLLLGADTGVFYDDNDELWTFIETHPVSNCASYGGENFLNGPVLSEDAYQVSIVENIVLTNGEVTYGYTQSPTATVTLIDGYDSANLSYQWYGVDLVEETYYVVENGTTNTLPTGMPAGTYKLEVYYTDAENTETYIAYALVTVKQKTITVTASTLSKIYDGTVSTAIINYDIVGLLDGDEVGVTHESATYADANAGTNKTITITGLGLNGDDAGNYELASTTITTTADILQKDIASLTMTLNTGNRTYTGKELTIGVVFYDSNLEKLDLVEGVDYTLANNKYTDVGDYTLIVTGIGNYKGTVTKDWSITFSNSYPNISYNGSLELEEWYTEDVEVTVDLYTVSPSLDEEFTDSYVVSAEGITDDLKLHFKDSYGYITDAREIGTIRIDKHAPADVAITVKDNIFLTFLDKITFGIFHIETQIGTISATDSVSGVEGYYYYIDKSGSTTVKTAEELDALTFTKNASFSLAEDGKYVIYAYAVDNAGNKSQYVCTDGIVIDTTVPTITDVKTPTVDNGNLKDTCVTISLTASEIGDLYYVCDAPSALDGITASALAGGVKVAMTAGTNTFTVSGLTPNTEYAIAIAAKDEAENYSAVTTVTFTTQKTLPTITADPTITGTYGQAVKDMDLTDGTASVPGTWAISSEATDVPEVGTTNKYVVIFTPADQNTYGSVTVEVTPTVAKKAITVTINDATKKFGEENPTFTYTVPSDALVGDDTEAALGLVISTTATKTSDVGTYAITGAENAKNYIVTITNGTLTITKATAINPSAIEKEYVYGLGSEGTATIDIAKDLPTDRGNTTYAVETNGSIVTDANVANGILTYKVSTGSLDDTATITVTATSKNYEDITITIQITLVDKLSVSAQGTVTTVGSLTYGDALSKLTFGEVSFVDTEGNVVVGTITWDTPDAKLDAGTHEVAWTFTPSNTGKYKTATGTVSVTVAKATPNVATPTVEGITYDPSKTLEDIALPTSTEGTWSWKTPTTVPTVGNEGYVAVFTPADTTNYNTVEKTVVVEVEKATPVVSVAPTASDIKYLNTLADSSLSGGKVVYADGSSVEVTGTWAWKDATIAPVVADSETTEYEVVFTPADTNNYNTVSEKITLVVEKADIPANAPATEMKVEEESVADIVLPEGWEWDEEDAEQSVERGSEVEATAIYTADDAENYETVKVVIKITLIEPEIYGDDGKAGWDAIEDEIENTQGEEVKVDMNGTTKVDRQTLETLKEKDKTMVVVFTDENGKDEYTWTIKGSDVEDGEFKNVKMDVEMTDDNKPEIPETLVTEAIANAKDHKFLSLTHDGEFGFKATLTINVGKENAGKLATLYYYNEETGKLLETENIKVEVDAEGNISLVFEHASDYVLSINEKVVEQLPGEDNTTTPGTTTPGTDDGVFGNIYFYITLLLAGGLAGYVGVRKKREA